MGLYLHGLDSKSLWFDELGTLTSSGWRGSWSDAIRDPLTIPTTPKPPLSFLITHLFLSLGDRVFLLRLQSALFATLTIPMVYALAQSLFPKARLELAGGHDAGSGLLPDPRRAGLLAACLLAVAPLYLRYAQEARMYALWTCLSVLSLYLFWRALGSSQGRWWVLFALVAVLSLYTHLFALLPLGIMILFALWLLLRPAAKVAFPFRAWHFAAALAVILVFYLPLAPFLAEGLVSVEGLGGEAVGNWGPAELLASLRLFSGGSVVGLILYGSLSLLGTAALATSQRGAVTLILMWILLPAAIVVLLPFSHAVRLRYFLFALPLYLLLVAYGLSVVLHRLQQRTAFRPTVLWWVLGALSLLLLVGSIIPRQVSYHAESKQRWQDAMSLLNARAQAGDQVFVRHVYHQQGLLFYARELPPGDNQWNEGNVQLFPQNLAEAFAPGDSQGKWMVGPFKERLLPGGEFETWIQPHYSLGTPTLLPPSGVPREAKLLAPTSYRTLAVVPIIPFELPLVRFWADSQVLPRGGCTWLHWAVEGVREVYLDGEGIVGYGKRQVCPTTASRYELRAIQVDGSSTLRQVEIAIHEP
jgi:4-amino-4-deoxy-L-arabinose transferase-like glycosyltransferase